MEKQTIYIKGMVCNRCMMTVKKELENLGLLSVDVSLGEASFDDPGIDKSVEIKNSLSKHGFSLLEDKRIRLSKEVKLLVEEVYSGDFDFPDGFRFSKLLSERLDKDFKIISDAFIAAEKKTIEQYMIEYRINKVKELIVYTDLTFSDIAFKLNFNSAAHLSAQFKQQTGLTPSFFKEVRKKKAEALFSNGE
jgi:AraC family transcriptional regulator